MGARFTEPHYFAERPWVEYVFIFCATLSQLFNLSITNTPLVQLNIVTEHYGASEAQKTWYQAAFSMSLGALILVSGRIGDVYGLKRMVMGGYAWATLWTVLLGASYWVPNINFYIICRAMQGAGLAFVVPNLMGIVGRVYPAGSRRKNIVMSLVGACAPIGGGFGVLFSGLISLETKYFNVAYFATVIALIIGMVLSWFSVPHVELPANHAKEVDWIGCSLGVSALVLFNFVWNQAPFVEWSNGYIIALLIVSVACFVVFFWYEAHIPERPLIPRSLFKSAKLSMVLLATLLGWGSFGILIFHYFQFVLNFRHYNPLEAGAAHSIVIFFGAVAAISCGMVIHFVPIYVILAVSMACFCAADILLAVMPVDQSYFQISMGVWIIGVFGMDWSFPAGSIVMSDGLPPEAQGIAGSLLNTVVNYGNSLFLGISGTIEKEIQGSELDKLRATMYFAIGLSATAFLITTTYTLVSMLRKKPEKPVDEANVEHIPIEKKDEEASISGSGSGSGEIGDEQRDDTVVQYYPVREPEEEIHFT